MRTVVLGPTGPSPAPREGERPQGERERMKQPVGGLLRLFPLFTGYK